MIGEFDRFTFQLEQSAQLLSQDAAKDLLAGRAKSFYAHSGMAVEHLAKAVLAKHDRSKVLADGKQTAEARRWAEENEPGVPDDIRTVSLNIALQRCEEYVGDLNHESLKPLVLARNGVMHTADPGGDTDLHGILRAVVDATDRLLLELGKEAAWLWGYFEAAMRCHADAHAGMVTQTVMGKLALARSRHEDTVKLYRRRSDLFLALVARKHLTDPMYTQIGGCPACRAPTAMFSGTSRVEATDNDQDGYVVMFTPTLMFCLTCGLDLRDIEELRIAGVDHAFTPEGVEIEDFGGPDAETVDREEPDDEGGRGPNEDNLRSR